MSRSIIASAVLVVAAISSGCAAAQSDEDAPRQMTVSGEGSANAAPDMAFVTAGVVAQALTAQQAMANNAQAMSRVVAELRELGVEGRDIQTTSLNLSPRYNNPPRGESGSREIVGYQAANNVQVRVRDLDALGQALDRLVEAGANSINGVSFAIEDTQALADAARRDAVADARRKAELLAEAAGVSLGSIVTIHESGGYYPRPVFSARAESMASFDTPVEAGEQTVTANVTIVYEIR